MSKKRKQFLVDKQVQYALGLRIMLHWVAFLSIAVIVSCALRMLSRFDHSSLGQSLQAAFLEQMSTIIVLLALLPWFIHDSLKLSNRFAGPMVRLRKSFSQLACEDELPPVSFRKGDFWQEVADDFNVLRSRVLEDRKQLAEACSAESELPNTNCSVVLFDTTSQAGLSASNV